MCSDERRPADSVVIDDPVSDNSGRLVSCGDNKWCCGPAAQAGICNCNSGSNTFSVQSGKAQTIIGSFGSAQTTLISFSSRAPSSTTEQSQKTTSQSTATALTPTSPVNTSSHSTTAASPLPTPSSSSHKSSHNTKLKVGLGTAFSFLALGIIAGWGLWWRKRARGPYPSGDGDNLPQDPYQSPNQPPPGQHPYEVQPVGPLQGGEPIVIAPDQDDNQFPPAITPSSTPRNGPFPSYSRLFQPRERATNVAEEENLQRRYTPDPFTRVTE